MYFVLYIWRPRQPSFEETNATVQVSTAPVAWAPGPTREVYLFSCVGIHPGRVESASPIELTTFRAEDALQARRSCASSLEAFTQSFLLRAWPKTRGPESGSTCLP